MTAVGGSAFAQEFNRLPSELQRPIILLLPDDTGQIYATLRSWSLSLFTVSNDAEWIKSENSKIWKIWIDVAQKTISNKTFRRGLHIPAITICPWKHPIEQRHAVPLSALLRFPVSYETEERTYNHTSPSSMRSLAYSNWVVAKGKGSVLPVLFAHKLANCDEFPQTKLSAADFEKLISSIAEETECQEFKLLWPFYEVLLKMKVRSKAELLHLAAVNGHYNIASHLCQQDAYKELNWRVEEDYESKFVYPIHHAVNNGHLKTVQLFLDNGCAKANIKHLFAHGATTHARGDNNTPLHIASKKGKHKAVEVILSQGSPVDSINTFGRTPLHYACCQRHVKVVRLLIGRGANVNTADHIGRTPLHFAASIGSNEIVQLLLEAGAEIVSDRSGVSPLHFAAGRGFGRLNYDRNNTFKDSLLITVGIPKSDEYHEILIALLDAGGNKDASDKKRCTPLHLAAEFPRGELLRILVGRGAEVNAVDSEGRTPLHIAAAKSGGNCSVLLDGGATVSIQDSEGKTPLHVAAALRLEGNCSVLLEGGAKTSIKDKKDLTPLSSVLKLNKIYRVNNSPYTTVIDCLKKAALEAADQDQRPPQTDAEQQPPADLHAALKSKDIPRCLQIIETGLNLEQRNQARSTPLHVAVRIGQLAVVKGLLQARVDIEAEDSKGNRPLHVAALYKKTAIIQVLLSSGACVFAENNKEETAFHIATSKSHKAGMAVLKKATGGL